MTRCPRCGFFHASLGAEACARGIPVCAVTVCLTTRSLVHSPAPRKGGRTSAPTEDVLPQLRAWVARHPGLQLTIRSFVTYATELPLLHRARAQYGSLTHMRALLGLTPGRPGHPRPTTPAHAAPAPTPCEEKPHE